MVGYDVASRMAGLRDRIERVSSDETLRKARVSDIERDPQQPRRTFEQSGPEELARSVRARGVTPACLDALPHPLARQQRKERAIDDAPPLLGPTATVHGPA